jgi:hypothetical protein
LRILGFEDLFEDLKALASCGGSQACKSFIKSSNPHILKSSNSRMEYHRL